MFTCSFFDRNKLDFFQTLIPVMFVTRLRTESSLDHKLVLPL